MELSGIDGSKVRLDESTWSGFAGALEGQILEPGSAGYEESVTIWNGMITKRPGVVVQPQSVADVARVVDLARDHSLELSVKGGGHNIAGLGLSAGGLTMDMSAMKSVEVDAGNMVAKVAPGCLLGDIDAATQEHGLATTLGFVSLTGAAGLTLGGGFGYLTRQYGWTVDDLLDVEMVLADSSVVRASRTENEDLFWAIRGGGGNFGVVTEFVYKLHEVGPEITGGLIAWSAEEAEGVMDLYREITSGAPRELTLVILMRNAPAAPWLSEDKHGLPMVAFVLNHTGDPESAERDVQAIKGYGSPWADLIQRKSYTDQQSMLDATMPDGMHYYWKSEFVPGLSDEMFAAYRAQFEGLGAPANQIAMMHLEGALNEHSEDDGAVGNRDAQYVAVIQSMYDGASGKAEENRRWVRNAWEALQPYATGGNYINFQTHDETADRISDSYRGNLDRLAEIKGKYDPTNLFRVNRNITPR